MTSIENALTETICPSCGESVSTGNFCPKCGKKLKEPAVSTSIGRQIFIYLFSFFIAPFGLGYAFKYLKQPDPKARKIGVVVLILTTIAIGIMVWSGYIFTKWEQRLLDGLLQEY